MSTLATSPASAASAVTHARLSFPGVVRSEWIKLRTVRSTLWCYGIMIVLSVGFGLLATRREGTEAVTGAAANGLVVSVDTVGVTIGELILAVLGVLVISGEYGTGMIRSTFAAVPKRIPAVLAKAVVLALTTFVVSLVSIWLTVLVTTPILSGADVSVDIGDSSVFMPLLGGSVFLTLIALLAFSFGLLLRSTAAGISATFGLLLVLPILTEVVYRLTNLNWLQNVSTVLPGSAGGNLYAYGTSVQASTSGLLTLNGWGGFFILLAWVVVIGGIASVLVKRRDA